MNISTGNYGFNPYYGRNPLANPRDYCDHESFIVGGQAHPPIDSPNVRRRRRHCGGHPPFYMHNHNDHPCCHERPRLQMVKRIDKPALSAGQGSYLDQMQANDQKRTESEARLKQMGFSKVNGSYSGYKVPPGGSLWTKGLGGALGLSNGSIESVSLGPDGTVAPAT